jgi:uncharacterized damage-inducible protein DinB
METCEHIADLLERTFDGEAWHGDSITRILQGITSEKALQKPIRNVHSIWEIVLHMIAWEHVVVTCLQGETYEGVQDEQDWPPVKETDQEAWQSALKRLAETTSKLKELMLSFPEAKLHEKVPGRNFTFYRLLHGMIQHNLYHGGQIAMLKK